MSMLDHISRLPPDELATNLSYVPTLCLPPPLPLLLTILYVIYAQASSVLGARSTRRPVCAALPCWVLVLGVAASA
jgi:hypothetical protein